MKLAFLLLHLFDLHAGPSQRSTIPNLPKDGLHRITPDSGGEGRHNANSILNYKEIRKRQ